MSAHRVFLVGDSLFSDTLSRLLGRYEQIEILGSAPNAKAITFESLPDLPDVFILAGDEDRFPPELGLLVEKFPNTPLICAELKQSALRVFTSQQYQARAEDLISVITSLPKRR